MAADEDALTVFSDYVCPFCYLGKAAMEAYLDGAEDPPAVEWHPFDLRGYKRGPDGEIDHGVEDGKDEEYFAQVRENVQRLAAEYGVEMTLEFSRDVDSWDAQKLALHLRESHGEETFRSFHERVFGALWREGRDIGDPAVLVDVAAGVGVGADEVRAALADGELDDRLRERFAAAADLGVTGVPTFAYDGHAARGAIPPEQFERLIEGG